MRASVNPLPPQLCITSPVRSLVKEKREVAKDTLLVVFDLQGQQVDFTPGQYFWVELLDPPYQDEKGPRRHIADGGKRARALHSPSRHGLQALARPARDRRRGGGRGAQGHLPAARGHEQ